MDVADEMREEPERFGIGEIHLRLRRRILAAQLGDRIGDHLHDIGVVRSGAARDVTWLLQRHIGEVEFIVMRIALGVCFFFVRGRAPAKRHIASLGAVREYRDLAEGSPLNRAAVLLVQQFAHALLRRGIVLQQDEIGDRTDDAVPGEVPCPGRRRNH
jgi:hypothetical protein